MRGAWKEKDGDGEGRKREVQKATERYQLGNPSPVLHKNFTIKREINGGSSKREVGLEGRKKCGPVKKKEEETKNLTQTRDKQPLRRIVGKNIGTGGKVSFTGKKLHGRLKEAP